VKLLRRADFSVGTSRNIADYLATHASMVAPLAGFLMQRGYDSASLKRYTAADLGLLIDAMREVLDVLPAVGFHIVPGGMIVLKIIPRFLWVAVLRAVLPSRFMEVGAMYHLSQAPDEMRQLGVELTALVDKSGLPVPALRACLCQAQEKVGQA
jgi:hypothetical protein